MNPIRITKDTQYSEMYRLEWEDGVKSDMYNLTRANDHFMTLTSDYAEVAHKGKNRRAQIAI